MILHSSPFAGGGPSSAVPGCSSSLISVGNPLSAVLGRLLSLIANGVPLSTVLGCPLSLVVGDGLLSVVLVRLLSFMPPAGSRALFLTSTPSCAHCSSLPSSPTPLAHDLAPLTGKRLFDQAFITQRPIASIRQ